MFSQYKWVIVAAVIGIAVAAAGWYKSKSDNLELKLEAAHKVVNQLQDSVTASRELADKHYGLLLAQREANDVIVRESHAKTVEINKYKDREQTVYRKPGLVEKLEQKAMDQFMEDLYSE